MNESIRQIIERYDQLQAESRRFRDQFEDPDTLTPREYRKWDEWVADDNEIKADLLDELVAAVRSDDG